MYQISVVSALFELRQKYGKEFLSVSEAAHELGLAYGSFRNLVCEGRSPVPTALVGKRRVVPLLGIAILTFEALTGKKVEIQFDPVGAPATQPGAIDLQKRGPGRPRKMTAATSSEVLHG